MMKATQKVRVIINSGGGWVTPQRGNGLASNEVSFYSTAKRCREGVGDRYDLNAAVYSAYWALEDARKSKKGALGVAGRWNGYGVQLTVVK